jgi:diguanylate cyclase (GGDEF)-like protein
MLLAAAPHDLEQLRPIVASPLLRRWDVVEADTLERVQFLGQMHPCDALVLDTALVGDADLHRLQGMANKPVVLLGALTPPGLELRWPSWSWLPRASVVQSPALLAATLGHLADVAALHECHARTQTALQGSRRRLDGMVDLLWQVVPGELPGPWFSQRHMLQRCGEEAARSRRYATPLSVVLGELRLPVCDDEPHRLPRWAAERLCQSTRHSDVAGQYGPHGFMLLLPSTSGAGAAACCRRLQELLMAPPAGELATGSLQLAVGIAECPGVAASVQELLGCAEEGLARAKVGGS